MQQKLKITRYHLKRLQKLIIAMMWRARVCILFWPGRRFIARGVIGRTRQEATKP